MPEYKISIIVPVYNVEKYLCNCMDSLVNQTLADIEIIAVNDGSNDRSWDILNYYKKRYRDKVKAYKIENHGVGYARNYGIDRAAGQYIMFVDSDDYIECSMCKELYEKAQKEGDDLVICGRTEVFEDDQKIKARIKQPSYSLDGTNFKLSDHKSVLTLISPYPWDKLFKRSLIANFRFPENIRFEDLAFVYQVIHKAQNIGVLNKPLYYYRRTSQGGFLNSFTNQALDIIKSFELLFCYMEDNGLLESYKEELTYICARHFFVRYLGCFAAKNKGNLLLKKQLINETQDFLDSKTPLWRDNHYLEDILPDALKRNKNLYFNRKKMLIQVTLDEKFPMIAAVLKLENYSKFHKKYYKKYYKKLMGLIKRRFKFVVAVVLFLLIVLWGIVFAGFINM